MFKYLKNQAIFLLAVLISLLSLVGGLIYRFYALNNIGVFGAVFLSVGLFIIILYFQYKNNISEEKAPKPKKENNSVVFLKIAYMALLAGAFYILFQSETDSAINSPWTEIPKYFFALYFLATTTLFLIIIKTRKACLFYVSLFYFLSFSIALIIYKIGFGFDPFVHEATESLIKEKGAVEPKPFYYLGQYALIIILNKITCLPIAFLNKIIVPLFSAIFLPVAMYFFLNKWFENEKINNLITPLLLVLGFSFWIITTPQNLAYLFLLLTILFGLSFFDSKNWFLIYVFALASLITHPIAGIPALLYAIALTLYRLDPKKLKTILLTVVFIIFALALPLAFFSLEKNDQIHNQNSIQENSGKWSVLNLWGKHSPSAPHQENFILNFIYLFDFNFSLILILLITAGIFIFIKNKNKENSAFFINLFSALSLLISYLFLKQLSFAYLIDYERDNFAGRILILAGFFALPFIIISFYWLVEKTRQQNKTSKIILFVFALLLISNSLYLSYPRMDNYYSHKSYAVSQNDLEAVKWIEENSSKDYIVLANQQVSAAALREFGFKKYYQAALPLPEGEVRHPAEREKMELYFYPIPTSSPLYQYYLKMVYEKPSKETMLSAIDFMGVEQAYFVLNKYWWAFEKIKEEAKLEADSWIELGNGEIFIFQYAK